MSGLRWRCALVLVAMLPPALVRAAEPPRPYQAILFDVAARLAGQQLYGIAYERNLFVVGVGIGLDIGAETPGFAAARVELDLVGLGLQRRYYGSRRNRGLFGGVSLGYVHGSGSGTAAGGRTLDYTYDGYEVALSTLGYRALLLRHLALEASIGFRQSLGYLRSGPGDGGAVGGYGFVLAGGAGVSF